MVMIMSTYRYNYLRVRQKKKIARLPSEMIFAVLPSSPSSSSSSSSPLSSSDELVETSLCNGFGTNDLFSAFYDTYGI